MRIILVFICGLVLVGCSSNNIAKNKTTISSNMEFLKINEKVCGEYKSTDDKIYGCGTSSSKSFELAKAKSLLNAKVIVSDSLSNSLIKNESQTIKEDTKTGISKTYDSSEVAQIFETSLNQYKIVYDINTEFFYLFLSGAVLNLLIHPLIVGVISLQDYN